MNPFISNKYTALYIRICDNAKQNPRIGYTECHHIIPSSLGGTNDQSNLVNLSAREHFICHLILTKMTVDDDKTKMLQAAWLMIHTGSNKINSHTYNYLRENRIFTKIHKFNISKAKLGQVHTIETKIKISKAKQGIPLDETHKRKISIALKGKPLSIQHKSALSIASTGVQKSELHKQNVSNAIKNLPKLTCPHCGTIGSISNMKRWHFSNCTSHFNQ